MAPIHIPNELWIVLSYLGFVMCAIPFPWHLEAWNTGTCLYMVWAGLANLNQAINSTVWNGNTINKAPVWCDISSRFFLGVTVGIPCASLCINRRLYQIASVRSVTVTRAEKRRAVMVDLAIGIGIPIIYMTLSYIVQGHRFNIYEDIGCFPAIYTTPLALVLISLPPLLIGCVSAVYCTLSIRAFAKSRRQFQGLLSGGSISANRYLRLMMLAGIEAMLTVPFAFFTIYESYIKVQMHPWLGWADTHEDFSRVDQTPAILWRSNAEMVLNLEMDRFFVCLCAFLFFLFFGFAEEARKHYRLGIQSVTKRMGISTSITFFNSTGSKTKGSFTSSMGKGTLPVSIERHVFRKHDSITSFTDVSASFSDSNSILDEKKDEKDGSMTHASSYDDIHFSDVGGTLADFRVEAISPIPSSGSSASSLSEPHSPDVAITRPSSIIETQRAMPPRHLSDSSAV
ncbi:Pheromone B alpha 3 receptor [Termitomyces sp. T112]|nr:Pheromone B alpha 3 receptor [Termitomyces sp. T112]